ncbi:aldo/keto reductase [Protaetiibacter larvae]|uniref:Aldo/keto reductase n=2 Tax=Protaetiibacter larvae TaxID=2592654 RepID=A0A5C1Y9P8_9MICO|nr:aldo/keto reductase [Protaetiibacter larvae]
MRTDQPVVELHSGAVPLAPTTRETAAIVGHFPPPRRAIGGSGLRVHPLGMSGKHFGSSVSPAVSVEILDAYASLGGNLVDTADSYADGESERIIGDWIGRRGLRDEFVVATKVGKSRAHPGLSAPAIAAAVDASLRRLATDRIDLLYLHLDDPEVPFEETLLAVDELIRAGKVRAFGMSDHTGHRLLEARVACGLLGVAPISALQNEYSLVRRDGYEGDLARITAQQGLAVMPRFPLAGGFLTGAYRSRADLPGSPDPGYLARLLGRRGRRVLGALDRVSAAHDAAVATIALAWLLTKPGVVAPVVSARSADELFDLMSGPDIRLTRHQLAELDRASD